MLDPREIWEELGIRDYKSNQEYYYSKIHNVTQEDIDRLSPDKIDNRIFWKYAPNLDSSSIAGNGATVYGANWINAQNLKLLKLSGSLEFISNIISPVHRVLEIGPGLGSFYQWLPHYIEYRAFDTCIRFNTPEHSVTATETNGIINRSHVESYTEKFDIVVSSNVFQHMSALQVETYLSDAHCMLSMDGYLIVSNFCKHSNCPPYIYTAGQFIPRISIENFMTNVQRTGLRILSVYHENTYGGFTIIAQKS